VHFADLCMCLPRSPRLIQGATSSKEPMFFRNTFTLRCSWQPYKQYTTWFFENALKFEQFNALPTTSFGIVGNGAYIITHFPFFLGWYDFKKSSCFLLKAFLRFSRMVVMALCASIPVWDNIHE
jgi:hypothetical protein